VTRLLVAIAVSEPQTALALLDAAPSLATAGLARRDEFFLAERLAQVYEGDTALHAAAFSYDTGMARELAARGAEIRARNRRGAEPLHAAVMGVPGSPHWNAPQQRAVILYLIEAGADPRRQNDSGSTAADLARWTTGRGGTGSAEAKAEQDIIIGLLDRTTI
jgi:hypothetical protein